MAVVGVREMGMCVFQRLMTVHVPVAFAGGQGLRMFMLVVRVIAMHVFVLVCYHRVSMFMFMPLAEMQRDPDRHQKATQQQ